MPSQQDGDDVDSRWLTRAEEKSESTELIKDTLFVAPRNGPTRRIDVAAEVEQHRSKRYGGMDGQSKELDVKKQFLREQALEKERIFKHNVENLRVRIREFQLKLQEEAQVRDSDYAETKEKFVQHLERADQHVREELEASVAVVAEEWLPPEERRLEAWKDDLDHFVNVTVPETIENQSGRVTRHLVKAQETFEIDNTKLLKREANIVARHAAHVKSAAANMAQVERKRERCFAILDKDMCDEEKEAQVAEEKHDQHCRRRVDQVEKMQSGLAGIRASNDSEILIGIEEAMTRLQKTVLSSFGTKS